MTEDAMKLAAVLILAAVLLAATVGMFRGRSLGQGRAPRPVEETPVPTCDCGHPRAFHERLGTGPEDEDGPRGKCKKRVLAEDWDAFFGEAQSQVCECQGYDGPRPFRGFYASEN